MKHLSINRIVKKFDSRERLFHKNIEKWFRDRGDETLRLCYDELCDDSLVFDLGGYKGDWAWQINEKYGCRVFVFEPVPEFCAGIRERFKDNDRISVFEFGLAANDWQGRIGLDDDGTSIFNSGSEGPLIKLLQFEEFVKSQNITVIDLMKINIEGGEYELLEHIIETGAIKIIKNIQVQFHKFVPRCGVRLKSIREGLKKTHHATWMYEYVWENWSIGR